MEVGVNGHMSKNGSGMVSKQNSDSALREKWVKLNVGGKVFMTTRSTLLKEPDSFLFRLCHDDEYLPSDRDECGAFLIDRDPHHFPSVLNYLRFGKLVVNPDMSEEGILEESDFYNLPGLSHLVEERIKLREQKEKLKLELLQTAADGKKQQGRFVYRVLQCHCDELTSMVSSMTDGWKLVQVLPAHVTFSAYSENQQEYLCIVAREVWDTAPVAEGQDRAGLLQQRARHN